MAAAQSKTGTMPKDGDLVAMQMAQSLKFEDGAATPLNSPLTVSAANTAGLELTIPTNAVTVVLKAKGANLRVGKQADISGGADKTYFIVYDGERFPMPCGNGASYFLAKDGANNITVSFAFDEND